METISQQKLSVNDTIKLQWAQAKAFAIAPLILIIGIVFRFFPILEKGSWMREYAFIISMLLTALMIVWKNYKYMRDQRRKIKNIVPVKIEKKWVDAMKEPIKYMIRVDSKDQQITREAYEKLNAQSIVKLHIAPKSKMLLDIELIENNQS